ncbi:MAG: acyltransferase [Acidimicrobiales bacterium]
MSVLAGPARRLAGRLRARRWAVVHRSVQAGPRASVGRGCRLRLDPGARLVLGAGCEVDDGVTLAVYGRGRLEIGAGSFVGHHATLAAHELVELGPGCYLAELVSVRDHDHAVGRAPGSGQVDVSAVRIGARCWLGAKVTVVRGAHVGEGTVVGAHAVVRGTLPAGVVAAGIPATVVRTIESTTA